MTHSSLPTIEQLIRSASTSLADCSDSPVLDAKVLLAHTLDKDLTYLLTWSDKALTLDQLAQFNSLLQLRIEGQPVAYITGTKEFWSLPFYVAPSTLIPRPDTETLIELVLANHSVQVNKPDDKKALLDLGTGTGAIALALASELPDWQVDAVDFNEQAVELAKKNANNLSLNQVDIYHSNWCSAIKDKRFDVIVSNPPYIDENDPHLDEGDVRFEPKTALVSENKGLADIEHISLEAKQYLKPSGALYFEHGYDQGAAVRSILTELGYSDAETVKDLAGNDRITWAKLG